MILREPINTKRGINVRPLLRWAGSKRSLLKLLMKRAPPISGRYVEPFAGSAILFFALEPKKAILGDINSDLMRAYDRIRSKPKVVWERLTALDDSSETYYHLRSLKPATLSSIEQAVRFLYLNRFCFNGVYRTNRRGEFNVPRGCKTGSFPGLPAFLDCASLLRCSELKTADFGVTLGRVQAGDFVYLDPPYFKRGRSAYGEYGYERFDDSDLDRLVSELRRLDTVGAHFLMSYSATAKPEKKFSCWNVVSLSVRRHVAGFSAGRENVGEILISNY